MSDIAQRMLDARIPPQAFRTNLVTLGQALLRAMVNDGSYKTQGALKSISLVCMSNDTVAFHTIVARFAAELLLKGQPVFYTRMAGLARELDKYANDPSAESLSPVLARLGNGYLVVPDICTGLLDLPHFGATDFLIDHVSMGGGLILGIEPTVGSQEERMTEVFQSVMSSFTQVDVFPGSSRPA